jgi:hypothetical protein
MNYKKADTTGLPEGTDWNTLFRFSDDGKQWTKPRRCIRVCSGYDFPYRAITGVLYRHIRPVEAWEPKGGEVCFFWSDQGIGMVIREFERFFGDGKFVSSSGRIYDHIARIDHLTRVPASVEELKEMVGEGNYL